MPRSWYIFKIHRCSQKARVGDNLPIYGKMLLVTTLQIQLQYTFTQRYKTKTTSAFKKIIIILNKMKVDSRHVELSLIYMTPFLFWTE